MIRRNMNKKYFLSLAASAFALVVTLNAAAWAMASRPVDPNAPAPPAWVQWAPMVALFAIFYFLMIRPQSKQRKEREAMLSAMKKGDKIITQSGFVATISTVGPRFLEVKLAEDVKITMLKSGVTEILPANAETDVTTPAATTAR